MPDRGMKRVIEIEIGTGRSLRSMRLMTIGQLAEHAGVTPRAIRHYERLGLIRAPVRTTTHYRLFDSDSACRLTFISKCRALGFSLSEIAAFLRILDDPDHTCGQAARLTREHLDLVDSKIKELMEIRRTLVRTLGRCADADMPDCPVLEFLNEAS